MLSGTLIALGALLLADVAVTLVWQEPITAAVALIRRTDTNKQYLSLSGLQLTAAQQRALARAGAANARIAILAKQEARVVPGGAALGHISIPAIGASYDFVQGTGTGDLERGPGHYASTALPGLGRTVAIAGHRTTYLAPFREVNELKRGDHIILRMPYGTFTYAVQRLRVVSPTALWITRNVGYDRLVLSACTPLFSAEKRIVLFARQIMQQSTVGPENAADD